MSSGLRKSQKSEAEMFPGSCGVDPVVFFWKRPCFSDLFEQRFWVGAWCSCAARIYLSETRLFC